MSYKAINAYKKDSLKQQLTNADPHKITLMLMSGAIDRLAFAKGCIERKDLSGKSQYLSKTTAILINLRDTIEMKTNPEFSQNLYALYDYMLDKIGEANITNTIDPLHEVSELLTPIRDAWAQIPDAAKQVALAQKEAVG
ncbi:MAG: flagellar export chaperone FliS [Glaciecola sp.]|jgi:flagellar protein FliS|nr:flagellar export chaperone FliS [Glaciecola sp.]